MSPMSDGLIMYAGAACFLGMLVYSVLLVFNTVQYLPALLRLKSRLDRSLVRRYGQ